MAMTAGGSDMVRRIPALDGLRGAAAIAVVISHASYTGVQISNTGGLGVTIFFTLSGFLMAFLYAHQPFAPKSVVKYGINRIARIAPLYLLIIIASFIIHTWIDSEFVYAITPSNIIRHLFFAGTQSVFWSISLEIQFYGFFLAIWWSNRAAQHSRFWPAIITCIVIVIMLRFSYDLPLIALPTKLLCFLFGSVSGLAARSQRVPIPPMACAMIQCAMVIAVPTIAITISDDLILYQSLPYAATCGLMVFAFSLPNWFGNMIFANRVLCALGEWSFAIYLIHDSCLYWTEKFMHRDGIQVFLIGASISFLIAWVLHMIVELPAQKWMKALINSWTSRPVPANWVV